MNVLITGGCGFIGFHLANFHAKKNDKVVIFDNLYKLNKIKDESFVEFLEKDNVFFYDLDLSKPIKCKLPFKIDIVYHLAAINGTKLFYSIPYELCKNNILATMNLLDFLEQTECNKIVYSSSSEVYSGAEEFGLLDIPTSESAPVVFPQPTDIRYSYGTSKFIAEFLCLQFSKKKKIASSVIRFHNIYGPRMGGNHAVPGIIIRLKKLENPFKIFGAKETRAFCYVDDAVRATYKVATSSKCNGEIIHIGNPSEEIQISDLTKIISKMMNIEKIDYEELDGLSASVSRRCPDITKLESLTNFKNRISLKEGLKKTIKWYDKFYE